MKISSWSKEFCVAYRIPSIWKHVSLGIFIDRWSLLVSVISISKKKKKKKKVKFVVCINFLRMLSSLFYWNKNKNVYWSILRIFHFYSLLTPMLNIWIFNYLKVFVCAGYVCIIDLAVNDASNNVSLDWLRARWNFNFFSRRCSNPV